MLMAWIWGNRDRQLTTHEKELLNRVFRGADLPPLERIRIRDGLTTTGVPFVTSGTTSKVLFGSLLTRPEEYLIMVGPRLFDEDLTRVAPATLVHEMVHVWQYKHKKLTELRGLMLHSLYYLSGKIGGRGQHHLYSYDLSQPWEQIGFEGQAQLVEDWYKIDHMKQRGERWEYLKRTVFADSSALIEVD